MRRSDSQMLVALAWHLTDLAMLSLSNPGATFIVSFKISQRRAIHPWMWFAWGL